MNTREEIEIIIEYINGVKSRASGESFAYKSGAYEAALELIQNDLETIAKVLETRENRIYP